MRARQPLRRGQCIHLQRTPLQIGPAVPGKAKERVIGVGYRSVPTEEDNGDGFDLDHTPEPLLGPAQRRFNALAFADIGKEHGNAPAVRASKAERVDVEPAVAQRLRAADEASRFPGGCDPAVRFEPARFVAGRNLPHAPADGVANTGLALERRIDLLEHIVDRGAHIIEGQLDDTESLIDGVEERVVLLLTGAQ
jgi:hypothetical protein